VSADTASAAGVTLHGALDVIRSIRDGATDQHPRVVATREDLLYVHGWVLVDGAPVGEVELDLDGAPLIRLVSGYAREDVRELHGEGALRCGFRGVLPLRGVAPGAHALALRVGAARIPCFRITPLLVAEAGAAAPTSEELALETGALEEAPCPIGTMLRVGVRAPAGGAEPFDAGLLLDGRWFVQGRPDGERFEVLVPTEQLGLGAHTARACAFAGEQPLQAAAAARFVVDDGT
jgi:hypothetical protein